MLLRLTLSVVYMNGQYLRQVGIQKITPHKFACYECARRPVSVSLASGLIRVVLLSSIRFVARGGPKVNGAFYIQVVQ